MASEREAWDTLMDRHHYLGFRVIVGESLRYVAFLGKRPVALIGWGAAAFKSRHRDAWIGWGAHLRWGGGVSQKWRQVLPARPTQDHPCPPIAPRRLPASG